MRELLGILLCIQGAGAVITKLLDGSRSWFLVRYVLPDGLQLPAGVALILLGLLVLRVRAYRRRGRAEGSPRGR